jgi:hypothetical protein
MSNHDSQPGSSQPHPPQSSASKRLAYYLETDEGCLLQAYPALLVDAWAARYSAVKHLREGSSYSILEHGIIGTVTFPLEAYVVPRSHQQYQTARQEAQAIQWMLNINPYNASAYYYYRAYLEQAGYSEIQLESVPHPQETPCLHMLSNGVFTCVGKIHKARQEGNSQRWYYCSDCAWVSPRTTGTTRDDLLSQGIFLVPIDATYPVPFASPSQAAFWTRRVLLQQGFLMTLTCAATFLGCTRIVLRNMCLLGLFHWFEHPNIRDEHILYRSEIEKYRHFIQAVEKQQRNHQ